MKIFSAVAGTFLLLVTTGGASAGVDSSAGVCAKSVTVVFAHYSGLDRRAVASADANNCWNAVFAGGSKSARYEAHICKYADARLRDVLAEGSRHVWVYEETDYAHGDGGRDDGDQPWVSECFDLAHRPTIPPFDQINYEYKKSDYFQGSFRWKGILPKSPYNRLRFFGFAELYGGDCVFNLNVSSSAAANDKNCYLDYKSAFPHWGWPLVDVSRPTSTPTLGVAATDVRARVRSVCQFLLSKADHAWMGLYSDSDTPLEYRPPFPSDTEGRLGKIIGGLIDCNH